MAKSKRFRTVDTTIGARLRLRRKVLGISQMALAAKLGVTFQMIHRYERASCRVSASTLHAMSDILDVPITFFFDRPRGDADGPFTADLSTTRDGRVVATMFPRISDPEVKHVIADLIEAAAGASDGTNSP